MLSGATWRAAAIVGTAVLRIVVSSDSIKNATAISHGTRRLLESARVGKEGGSMELGGLTFL
jgi:tRNA C32,U32 (ribose-2'-O)-methylase TrmJ